jgi:hypothetical protein
VKNSSIRSLVALSLVASMAMPAFVRAEETTENDLKVRLEALEEAVEGFNKKNEEFSKAYFEGFVNLRYDQEANPSKNYLGEQTAPTLNAARTDDNGQNGFYLRRGEAKWSGRLADTVVYSLGFDFVEGKIKDAGVEFRDVNLIPYLDMPELLQTIRLGQYRMPFGIYPQASSSAILFPERPFTNGGRLNNNSGMGAVASVGERVMGVQNRVKAKSYIISADIQAGLFNNMTQDQAATKNKLQDAFDQQDNDGNLSYAFRTAFEHNYIYGILPEKSKIQTGFSYFMDKKDANYQTGLNAGQLADEVYGLELLINVGPDLLWQTEWLHRNNNMTGNAGPASGIGSVAEGWYSEMAWNFLPLVKSEIEKGDALQLAFRIEEQVSFNAAGAWKPLTRLSQGLKWSYMGGKNHTSINYFVMAPDHQYGGDYRRAGADRGTGISAPETQIVVQQQWAWETGKP